MLENNNIKEELLEFEVTNNDINDNNSENIINNEKDINNNSSTIINNDVNKDNNKTFNLNDNSFIEDIINKKTKESKTISDDKDNKSKESIDETRAKILEEEKRYEDQFTREDLEEISGFIIDALDTFGSSWLRTYGKDTSDTAYSIPELKRKRLIKMLTNILIKYKLKVNIELLFLVTLFVTYRSPFMKARENRSRVINKAKKENSYGKLVDIKDTTGNNIKDENQTDEFSHRRRPGRPTK
jgi:hypothetical protein